ncbi:MAG: pyrroline-5-carboxylate reductase [Phycisphaerales bacterium]
MAHPSDSVESVRDIRAMLVVGGGAMASAILAGSGDGGGLPERVCVVDPNPDRRAGFRESAADLAEGLAWLDSNTSESTSAVLLAVKPQMLAAVNGELERLRGETRLGDRLVISILAGTTLSTLQGFAGPRAAVVRVMPNTPAQIGMGASAIAVGASAARPDIAWVRRLFRGVGDLVLELDEALMDAFTAVAGSGPAYVFYLAEAMQRGAVAVGLTEVDARRIVMQTLAGAAELLRRSSESPAELRARVTSRGGTTAAAVAVLDEQGVFDTVARAIEAARDRGRELGG